MNIVIVSRFADNFYPLSLTRASWELFSGTMTFMERFDRFFSKQPGDHTMRYLCDDSMSSMLRSRYTDVTINQLDEVSGKPALVVTGTVYPGPDLMSLESGTCLVKDNQVLAYRTDSLPGSLQQIEELFQDATMTRVQATESFMATSHWDLVAHNGSAITADVQVMKYPRGLHEGVSVMGNRDQVFCHPDAVIEPLVVIVAEDGPVVIDQGAHVHAFSRLEGPCYIGRDSIITGARIREETSIGPVCRVGGEIEACIFQGWSNKYHDGFLGHSVVGQWVNMGAMTTNSDLKNNYRDVSVYTPAGTVETGSMKVGSVLGDFVKTSIGTLMNTGSVIGTGAMVVHDGSLVPSHVPPFQWLVRGQLTGRTSKEGFLRTTREMMKRRKRELPPEEEDFLCNLVDQYLPE